jgi:hypothetical protein
MSEQNETPQPQTSSVVEQKFRLFTDSLFQTLFLILNAQQENRQDGVFVNYTIANMDLISITDDDLMLTPYELIHKYQRLTHSKDAWLFTACVRDVQQLRVPVKAVMQGNMLDILCINRQTGQWDIPPSEWFTFDLRSEIHALRQENMYLKHRDRQRTQQQYLYAQELQVLHNEVEQFEQTANTLLLLVGEHRRQSMKYAESAYQQAERNVQMNARLRSQETLLKEYSDFRNKELPKLLKNITNITKDLSGVFKEWQLFLSHVDSMSMEDVQNFQKQFQDSLNSIKTQVDKSVQDTLDNTIKAVETIKKKEQALASGEEGGHGSTE